MALRGKFHIGEFTHRGRESNPDVAKGGIDFHYMVLIQVRVEVGGPCRGHTRRRSVFVDRQKR